MSSKKTHQLKIIEPYFTAVRKRKKTFEIRENDRKFLQGDTVILRLYDPIEKKYIGDNWEKRTVGFVTDYGQKDGFVVFSLLEL